MIDPEIIDRAIELLKRRANYEYFFGNLKSSAWIEPLKERGFFVNPPEPQTEDGGTWFPPWPESRYLARVAGEAPRLVLDIALNIPETENVRVHEDLIDVALNLTPELAAELANKVASWLETPYLLLPTKAASLVTHLALGEQVEDALNIAKELLRVVPARHIDQLEESPEQRSWRPEPQPRIDIWEFEQFIENNLPDLVRKAPVQTLSLVSDRLDEALRIRQGERSGFSDYSQVWRPAIEPHPQNARYGGVLDHLVDAVRDTALQLVDDEPEALRKVASALEARSWTVFKRVALLLAQKFGQADEELVGSILTNRAYFDDSGLRHEYAGLASQFFGELEPRVQNTLLDWIDDGPDLSIYVERVEDETGSRPTADQLQRRAEYWKLEWLTILRDSLPEDWRRIYESLVEEYGEPEHPDFLTWSSGVKVGPKSPLTPRQLEEMSTKEVIGFLQEWEPPTGFMAESPEGLSRALKEIVAKSPEAFGKHAASFEGVDATYVRGVVAGLREAASEGRGFDWQSVLSLCNWVVAQPMGARDRDRDGRMERDPHWGWARKEIARLLEEGLKIGTMTIPFGLRTEAWSILEGLADDPDPSAEFEKRYGGSNMDPATMSINTTRGAAMHAIVRYSLWCHDQLQANEGEGGTSAGFEAIPEARAVLEEHLDRSREPSLAVRSVYGWWFPALSFLDQEWATDLIPAIFAIHQDERLYWEAAWDAFVRFNQPRSQLLDQLSDEYLTAIQRASDDEGRQGWVGDPNERLSEHMMTYYWWGDLNIDSGLFDHFWASAPANIRAHALTYIGRSLYKTPEQIPRDVAKRLMELWEVRLAKASAADDIEEHVGEIAAFGWWFASGKLSQKWSMDQLREVISVIGRVEAGHLVVQQLASLTERFPKESVALLAAMVETDKKGWGLHLWGESAKELLRQAIAAEDRGASKAARDLIHRLGARGFLEYRELLS